jgi:hypothetical protein
MANELEVPHALAGVGTQREKTVREQIVAGAVWTVVVECG